MLQCVCTCTKHVWYVTLKIRTFPISAPVYTQLTQSTVNTVNTINTVYTVNTVKTIKTVNTVNTVHQDFLRSWYVSKYVNI